VDDRPQNRVTAGIDYDPSMGDRKTARGNLATELYIVTGLGIVTVLVVGDLINHWRSMPVLESYFLGAVSFVLLALFWSRLQKLLAVLRIRS
jgi:hypothetical protein